MTWYSWQSNQRNPDRLYELIERQINQTSESLKVQESALKEIQEFSVRVPMEHQSAEVKLTMIDTNVARVDAKVDRISADNAALRDAIQSQIEVITKLVKAMEVRNGGGT
jgi:septal ring factor EnvC (AmiA/AmiB activator)